METGVLTDKNQFPDEEIIFSNIGKNKLLWISLFGYIHEHHPEINEEWRYYNDGKSWLLKITRKSKTIFWLSVIKGTFRITFYFSAKAEKAVYECPISEELKEQFRNGKGNKIRGITVVFKNKKSVEEAKELIGLKLSIKI